MRARVGIGRPEAPHGLREVQEPLLERRPRGAQARPEAEGCTRLGVDETLGATGGRSVFSAGPLHCLAATNRAARRRRPPTGCCHSLAPKVHENRAWSPGDAQGLHAVVPFKCIATLEMSPRLGSPEEREATRKAAASLPDEWRVQVSVSAVPAGLIEAAFDGPGGAHGSATCREGHLDDVVKYLEAVLREYAERGQS